VLHLLGRTAALPRYTAMWTAVLVGGDLLRYKPLFQPVVSTAIVGIYAVIVGHLFMSRMIGGIESFVTIVEQGWRARNSSRSP
jgi:hypothetical protein